MASSQHYILKIEEITKVIFSYTWVRRDSSASFPRKPVTKYVRYTNVILL